MSTKTAPDTAVEYETDFYAWTQDQAELLRARRHNEIDWENVAEEIDSVGRSQKNEIRNRMARLLSHLLKWQYQPERRGNSWQSTISGQRTHLDGLLDTNPSLHSFPEASLDWAYQTARREAARETGLALATFPVSSPYSIGELLDHDFMPGAPWSPEQLLRD